jgi:hypothetical protein
MSAYLAGLDLVGLLLGVSQGETPATPSESRAGVRTHLAMQVLLGCASRGGTRRDLVSECWRLLVGSGPYADSTEELTPVRLDWFSVVPLVMTAMFLLAAPKRAATLARGGWGAHLLDPGSIRLIESEDFPLERLIVLAIAVALRRGDVAILDVVVLDRFGRRFLRFIVVLAGKFVLFAGSTHVIPLDRMDRCLAQQRHSHIYTLTSIPSPLASLLTAVRQSFLPFSSIQCKGRRNQSMIRKSGNRFSEKIMLKQRDEIVIRSNRIMI